MRRGWRCKSSESQGWDELEAGGVLLVREPLYGREYGAWFFWRYGERVEDWWLRMYSGPPGSLGDRAEEEADNRPPLTDADLEGMIG